MDHPDEWVVLFPKWKASSSSRPATAWLTKMTREELYEGMNRAARDTVVLRAIGPDGRIGSFTTGRCAPVADPFGVTDEDKGSTRYLGIYLSFTGTNQVMEEKLECFITAFFKRIRETKPTMEHLRDLFSSLLASKLIYMRQILPESPERMTRLMDHMTAAVQEAAGLPSKQLLRIPS